MAQEIANSTLIDTWGSSGAKIEPDISKIIEGWQLGEQPPHEYMNWLQNTFGSKLNHILKNGVAKWNDETEYLAGSSVQHIGNVWLCKATNTNSEPTDSNNNWDKIPTLENLALTVDTINDFPTSATTGDTCIVKDLDRGGIFIYDSTKVAESNNGTNFNGWIRQYTGLLDYKWFGLSSFDFFVSTTGSDSNNGFTASTPFLTIQKAVDTYASFRRDIGEDCTIHLAAGIYTEGAVINGIKSDSAIIIEGDNKTNTIIDGTTASNIAGLNFNGLGYGTAIVKNITARNFVASGRSGFLFQNGTRGVVNTCDATDNSEANFNCSEDCEMVFLGACTASGGDTGMRYYRNCSGSVGDGANPIVIDGCKGIGILSRDGSKVVTNHNFTVKNCNFLSSSVGVLAQKDGYVELRTCTIENNSIGIAAENNSLIDTQSGTRTLIGNTTDYKIVQNSADRSLYDSNQGPMQIFTPRSKPSGQNYSVNYDIILDYDGPTGYQILSNGNSIKIDFDKSGRLSYSGGDKTMRLEANGAEYRWKETGYYPSSDNNRNLGLSFARWSTIYAGTGTINTSDDREKTYLDITEIEKQVALELKANMKKFKFNDAIEIKGEKARIHFGASAQTVKSIFEKYGLNGFDYAILCYDEWEEQQEVKDEDGNIIEPYRPIGNRYGIRYEELLCFIISAL